MDEKVFGVMSNEMKSSLSDLRGSWREQRRGGDLFTNKTYRHTTLSEATILADLDI
jgi:hypothetical protein